ncbi:MAG: GNAT family N-acetyltransferase [Cyclobacteriaceae bacterium]
MNNVTIVIASDLDGIRIIQKMRREIFGQEQGIPEQMDLDGKDESSIHLLLYKVNSPEPIASGRLTIEGNTGTLSRIAVGKDFRGTGVGKRVVQELEKIAKEKKVKKLTLDPHVYLEKFYTDLGYEKIPGFKQVMQHQLITMIKNI